MTAPRNIWSEIGLKEDVPEAQPLQDLQGFSGNHLVRISKDTKYKVLRISKDTKNTKDNPQVLTKDI